MAINYERLMAMKKLGQKYSYCDRDVMLYAIGIGMGSDPLDEKELAFVNEATMTARPLKVVPTFASVAAGLAEPGEFNLNSIALDDERDITFYSTLPPAADITADSGVIAVYDKNKDKGAVIRFQAVLKTGTGEPLATLVTSYFARADAGFGGSSLGQPETHRMPSRAPTVLSTFQPALIRSDLQTLRRSPPAAFGSGIRQEIWILKANSSRRVHVRNHLPRCSPDLR